VVASRLGERLGLDDDSLKALRRAGYLHDIGKIAIPDAILLKPGRLTQDEWTVMRSHVNIGVEICSPLRSLKPVLPIIRHHHERADGSGYPDRLQGNAIPLLARVFQVVDVFDALTSNRPYRKALTPTTAFATLREEVHKGWWDERIVSTFAALVEEEHPLDSDAPAQVAPLVLAGGRL
jgi:putative two-component system response regulator